LFMVPSSILKPAMARPVFFTLHLSDLLSQSRLTLTLFLLKGFVSPLSPFLSSVTFLFYDHLIVSLSSICHLKCPLPCSSHIYRFCWLGHRHFWRLHLETEVRVWGGLRKSEKRSATKPWTSVFWVVTLSPFYGWILFIGQGTQTEASEYSMWDW
jgi:hypothetical protein